MLTLPVWGPRGRRRPATAFFWSSNEALAECGDDSDDLSQDGCVVRLARSNVCFVQFLRQDLFELSEHWLDESLSMLLLHAHIGVRANQDP